jgi:hypothetical protein
MSALGQKRTSAGRLGHVRFTPKSGHWWAGLGMSALCQKRTLAELLDHLVGKLLKM